jgi:hypothetical protein
MSDVEIRDASSARVARAQRVAETSDARVPVRSSDVV